jgi:DNA-binding HxlR family transcriptional regulator
MKNPPPSGGVRLADLCHHRWAIPVMAELHLRRGAKFVTLRNALRVSPDSLRRTLDSLAERGLVERNPGYGHPMRPEWVLTMAGRRLGPPCVAVHRGVRRLGIQEAAGRKWTLPVLLALRPGESRFSEIERALPAVTARALTRTLRDLEAEDMVLREVEPSRPPAVTYRLGPRARGILPVLADLAVR